MKNPGCLGRLRLISESVNARLADLSRNLSTGTRTAGLTAITRKILIFDDRHGNIAFSSNRRYLFA